MRQLLHIVVAIVFWLVLVGLWVLLVAEDKATGVAFRDTLFRVAVIVGVVFAVTTWWIRHNVGIYRRKGPRQGRPTVPPRADEDRLGGAVRWSMPGGLRTARAQRHLVVDVDGDEKIYRRGV